MAFNLGCTSSSSQLSVHGHSQLPLPPTSRFSSSSLFYILFYMLTILSCLICEPTVLGLSWPVYWYIIVKFNIASHPKHTDTHTQLHRHTYILPRAFGQWSKVFLKVCGKNTEQGNHDLDNVLLKLFRNISSTGHQWFMPVILATWEAEIRIVVWGQSQQTDHKTPSPKEPE
jgi:hypothetical protein